MPATLYLIPTLGMVFVPLFTELICPDKDSLEIKAKDLTKIYAIGKEITS